MSNRRNPFKGVMAGLGYLLVLAVCLAPPASGQVRSWPDTTYGIFVFNDQVDFEGIEALRHFAADHYVGCQKILRVEARHVREYNSNFLVLHYRLGQGLGHSIPSGCNRTVNYIQIIDGDDWVQEWPGDSAVQDAWYYHYSGSHVFNCEWGYYLMNLADPGWRAWWSGKVIQQLQDNEDDGLFADSYSVPNYLGAYSWYPNLPEINETFEAQWAAAEHDFTDYIKGRFAGKWKWIPNLGSWITTRDPSDYSNVDGAMIEGFAEGGHGAYYDIGDWELQMDRVLGLVNGGKIVIAQSYPDPTDVSERLFILGSYLLVKAGQTYLNLEYGDSLRPEWFPEYRIELGAPLAVPPSSISALYCPSGVYARDYANGHVYVNPGTEAVTVGLGGATHYLIVPSGGGLVPDSGAEPGSLAKSARTSVSVPPHGAVIVLNTGATCTLSCTANAPSAGKAGLSLAFSATATSVGCGSTPAFAWTFGDGGQASGNYVTHKYPSAGTYVWTLTVTAGGKTCMKTGTVTISVASTAPVISSMRKLSAPFRIRVLGSRLQKGIKVYINDVRWTKVSWVSTLKIVLNGGAALKAVVPRNTPTQFRFVNPDGSSTTKVWSWT